MEETQQAQMRRNQDTLIIAGSGVIAFCVWSCVKTALFLTLADPNALNSALSESDTSMSLVYLMTGALLLVDLAARMYVGLSARAEGRGARKGSFYLIVAALAAATNASSVVFAALGLSSSLSYLDLAISIVIEATVFAALALIVYCALRLRRLREAAG